MTSSHRDLERALHLAVGHQLPDPLAVQHVELAPAALLRNARGVARASPRSPRAPASRRLVFPVERRYVDAHRGPSLDQWAAHRMPVRRPPCPPDARVKATKVLAGTSVRSGIDRADEMPVLADVDPCAVRVPPTLSPAGFFETCAPWNILPAVSSP